MRQEFKYGTVILGDSKEIVPTLKKVNTVITDPPYFMKKDTWDRFTNNEIYYQMLQEVLNPCVDILAKNGNLLLFHDKMNHINEIINFMKKTPMHLASFAVWDKGESFRANYWKNRSADNNMKTFFNVSEYILHYTFYHKNITSDRSNFRPVKDYLIEQKLKMKEDKGWNTKTFSEYISEITQTSSMASRHYFENHQWTMPSQRLYEKMQESGYFEMCYEELKNKYKEERETLVNTFNTEKQDIGNLLRQHVIQYKDVPHATPKPIPLISRLIGLFCGADDIVLDPFFGSATLGIAVNNRNINYGTNIRYIGIEKEPKIFDSACERLYQYESKSIWF